MNLDPRIGTLNSGRFYAFVHGYDKPETIGTLHEVEVALGLRAAPAPAAKPRRARVLRSYVVTVTTSWLSGYDDEPGSHRVYSSYEFETDQGSAAEAVSAARRDFRDREGDRAIRDLRPAYSARRAD